MTRIDNGWDIPPSAPLQPNTTPPPNHGKLTALLTATDIRPACMRYPNHPSDQIYSNENELYNILFDQDACELSLECSRYNFHMYLRWCTTNGEILKLFRGTDVLVTGRCWGDMSEVTRVEFGERHGSIKRAGKPVDRA